MFWSNFIQGLLNSATKSARCMTPLPPTVLWPGKVRRRRGGLRSLPAFSDICAVMAPRQHSGSPCVIGFWMMQLQLQQDTRYPVRQLYPGSYCPMATYMPSCRFAWQRCSNGRLAHVSHIGLIGLTAMLQLRWSVIPCLFLLFWIFQFKLWWWIQVSVIVTAADLNVSAYLWVGYSSNNLPIFTLMVFTQNEQKRHQWLLSKNIFV